MEILGSEHSRTPEQMRASIQLASRCWHEAILTVAEELGGDNVLGIIKAGGMLPDMGWSNAKAMKVMNFIYPGIDGYIMERSLELRQ